jgi:hypothetical protein
MPNERLFISDKSIPIPNVCQEMYGLASRLDQHGLNVGQHRNYRSTARQKTYRPKTFFPTDRHRAALRKVHMLMFRRSTHIYEIIATNILFFQELADIIGWETRYRSKKTCFYP